MSVVVALALILGQCLLVLAAAPLVVGVMRQARARLEGRVGAGIWQPWRDLRKLARKEPLVAPGVLLAATVPVVMMGTSILLVALLPLLSTASLPLVPDDLFVVVSVLLLGSVAIALLGLDAGTAFGGMGSSRHMMITALVEPTILVAIYALSIPAESSTLTRILSARLADPASVASPVSLLALVALLIVVVAETGRLPVDNPSTHLELTMVHEAMVLEASGRDLGWIEYASWLRLTALIGLVVNLAAPWGLATVTDPGVAVPGVLGVFGSLGAILLAALALLAKTLVGGLAIAVAEVFLAKLRLFRVPELLAGSFVLALLAVTASYLAA